MPSSSRISRARHASGVSPGSHLPPGNSQYPGRCVPSRRRVTRNRPSRSMTAAITGTTESNGMRILTTRDGHPSKSGGTELTLRGERADRARGVARPDYGGAEVHECLVEVEDVAVGSTVREISQRCLFIA